MATDVDICNAALSFLGCSADVASISPAEGGEYAERCAREYPICRDLMLESYTWSFATQRVALGLVGEDKNGWKYVYTKPSNALFIASITEDGDKYFERPYDFICEVNPSSGKEMILTDCPMAYCRYTFLNADTGKYPEKFCQALSLLLASRLAGSIIRGREGITIGDAMRKLFTQALSEAKHLDTRQVRNKQSFIATWDKTRGWRK